MLNKTGDNTHNGNVCLRESYFFKKLFLTGFLSCHFSYAEVSGDSLIGSAVIHIGINTVKEAAGLVLLVVKAAVETV